MRIICDTNVWYRMATGEYTPDPNSFYVATDNSLYEFVKTPNLATKPLVVQSAVRAMFKYHHEIIPVSPFGYVLHEYSEKYGWDPSFTYKLISSLQKFASFKESEILEMNELDIKELEQQCQQANEQNKKFQAAMTRYINDLRTRDKSEIDINKLARSFCLTILNDSPECQGMKISESEMNWSIVELFIAVTSNYLSKMLRVRSMKVDENDGADWINTLYVQPGQKYLTFDKRWKSLINEDRTIRSYSV